MADEKEVETSFWLSRPDGWLVNRKMMKIVLLEFRKLIHRNHTTKHDMRKVMEKQHTPILTGPRILAADRDWEVEVVPLVVGQRSVKEKE